MNERRKPAQAEPVGHFIQTSPGNWDQAAALYASQPGVVPLYLGPSCAEAAQTALPTDDDFTDKAERMLSELVDKIMPGLDTGDLLADAVTASRALDAVLSTVEQSGEAVDEKIEAIIACLGDDAATLRNRNPEDEMAANMDEAARLLSALAHSRPAREQSAVDAERYNELKRSVAIVQAEKWEWHAEDDYEGTEQISLDDRLDAARNPTKES